ncbi:hypothetical protein [Ruegeria sp. HKCCD8929]|uniref:hypothetical protein n=1 Tax=Ruegeria sp. HKCCD8929 TaxID=2683006 RepID=UPI001489D598|nr:hypothetical protein [Ruegeria sp. HKCCD8929]
MPKEAELVAFVDEDIKARKRRLNAWLDNFGAGIKNIKQRANLDEIKPPLGP